MLIVHFQCDSRRDKNDMQLTSLIHEYELAKRAFIVLYVSYWCKSYLKGIRSYVSACIMATFIVALWKCNEAMCENLAVHFEEQPNDAIISIANYASGSAGSFSGFKPSHTLFLYLLSTLKLYTYLCPTL